MGRFIVSALILSGLIGCNEMTHQLCTPELRSDYPALEQSHKIAVYDSKTFQTFEMTTKGVHKERGVYAAGTDEGAPLTYTCEIAGRRIAESYNSKLGTWSFQILEPVANGYETAWLGFNRSDLDQAGIDYEIVEDTGSQLADWIGHNLAEKLGLSARPFDENEKIYRMIIHTKNLKDPAQLIRLGKVMGMRVRATK